MGRFRVRPPENSWENPYLRNLNGFNIRNSGTLSRWSVFISIKNASLKNSQIRRLSHAQR